MNTTTTTDHRAEAKRLIERAHHYTYGDGGDPVTGAAFAAEAQVHATLALVTTPARHPLEDHRGAWTVLHLDGGATVEGHLMRFQGGYVDVRHQVTGDTATIRMDTITRYDIPA